MPGQHYVGVIKNRYLTAVELEVRDEFDGQGKPMIVRATKFDNDHIVKWDATRIGDVCSFKLTVGRDNRLLVVNMHLLKAGQRESLDDHLAVLNHDHARGGDYVDSVIAHAQMDANGAPREAKEQENVPYDDWLRALRTNNKTARTKEDILPVLRDLHAIVITQKMKYPKNSPAAIRCLGIAIDNLSKPVNERFVATEPSGMGDIGLDCSWPWVTVSAAELLWPDSLSPNDDEQQRWRAMFNGDREQHRLVLEAQAKRNAMSEAPAAEKQQLAEQAQDIAMRKAKQLQQEQLAALDAAHAKHNEDETMADAQPTNDPAAVKKNGAESVKEDVAMEGHAEGVGVDEELEALL